MCVKTIGREQQRRVSVAEGPWRAVAGAALCGGGTRSRAPRTAALAGRLQTAGSGREVCGAGPGPRRLGCSFLRGRSGGEGPTHSHVPLCVSPQGGALRTPGAVWPGAAACPATGRQHTAEVLRCGPRGLPERGPAPQREAQEGDRRTGSDSRTVFRAADPPARGCSRAARSSFPSSPVIADESKAASERVRPRPRSSGRGPRGWAAGDTFGPSAPGQRVERLSRPRRGPHTRADSRRRGAPQLSHSCVLRGAGRHGVLTWGLASQLLPARCPEAPLQSGRDALVT